MKRKEVLSEISLGNYVKKATQSKAMSQMDKAFGYPGDHDSNIAKREKGLMRAKRRGDAKMAAMRKDATANEPSKEELHAKLRQLRKEFDPNYEYSDDYSFWSKQKSIADQMASIERKLRGLDEGADNELKQYLMKDVYDKLKHLNQMYTKAKQLGDSDMMSKIKVAMAKVAAKKAKLASELGISEAELDEMNAPTTGIKQQGKIQKVNPDGTADVVDPTGTVHKINQKDIAPDSTDPTKLNANVPKPKIQAGTSVGLTMEEMDTLKKLAGL